MIEFRRTGPDNPKVCGLTVAGEGSSPDGSSSGAQPLRKTTSAPDANHCVRYDGCDPG